MRGADVLEQALERHVDRAGRVLLFGLAAAESLLVRYGLLVAVMLRRKIAFAWLSIYTFIPLRFAPIVVFTPIPRRRLYQGVSEQLERMIREGIYTEGDALPPERELMERFKVGRPAIREALLSLQKSGLVALSNGERARVSRPTPAGVLEELSVAARVMLATEEGVRQFQSARRLIEMALVREAAVRASVDDIALLRAALDRNRAARGDSSAFQASDVAFHLQIARIAASPLLVGVQQALARWLTAQRTVTLKHEGSEAEAFDFHRRIFDAIAARDPDTAERVMSSHLERVAELYWLQSGTRADPPRSHAP